MRRVAAALGLAYLLPLGRGGHGDVFKARGRCKDAVAVKCVPLSDEERARRVQRELRLAAWAADSGLGPPILRSVLLPEAQGLAAACTVMPCADCDLQAYWQGHARKAPLAETQRLWSEAFALVQDPRLCKERRICTDLKPANLLLFAQEPAALAMSRRVSRAAGRGSPPRQWQLRLSDFDPRFWRRAETEEAARLHNTFTLLSNALFLLSHPSLTPHLPETALAVARLAVAEDAELLRQLQRLEPWLRRGLLHYSGASDAREHLRRFRERAAWHGLADQLAT